MDNIFAKKPDRNGVKQAALIWIIEGFENQKKSEFIFAMGDLEDGIREIIGNKDLPLSSLRAHTSNMRGKYITVSDKTFPTKPANGNDPKYTPACSKRDVKVSVNTKQVDMLRNLYRNWFGAPDANPGLALQRDSIARNLK